MMGGGGKSDGRLQRLHFKGGGYSSWGMGPIWGGEIGFGEEERELNVARKEKRNGS